jgi:hypothetical protein
MFDDYAYADLKRQVDQLIKIYKIVGNNQVTLPMFLCFDSQ